MNHPPPEPPPAPQTRSSSGTKVVIAVLIGCGGLIGLGFLGLIGALFWLGTVTPDTAVVPGAQIDSGFLETIDETGVLAEDETILFFYSDVLVDITNGFYLLTDRQVVAYNESWPEPAILMPFDEIVSAEIEYNKSFFEDSLVHLELTDGSLVTIPVSSDYDRDEMFFKKLQEFLDADE